MNEEKNNKKEQIEFSVNEVGEDATKYGEFISSYFAWISLPDQKKKAEELENIAKKKIEENKRK